MLQIKSNITKELAELERVSLSKEKDLARFKAELENLQNSVSEKQNYELTMFILVISLKRLGRKLLI